MVFDFLEPVEDEVLESISQLSGQAIGKNILFHSKTDFPEVTKVQIAIVGVIENRGLSDDIPVDLTNTRLAFYKCFPGNWHLQLADLGNIQEGNTQEDTFFAVAKLVEELSKKNIITIVLGGSQDLTYALYRSFDNLDQTVNLVSIDSKFDFGKEEPAFTNESYMSKIILNQPNNLFNFTNIGYQTYYIAQEELDLLEKLYFDAYRLGEVSSNLAIAEPALRDADLVSVDLHSIQSSYSASFSPFVPNGFDGKEICALLRYSGISDKVSVLGIFNGNSSLQQATLVAQMMWYFIEGCNFRIKEYPTVNKNLYLKYIVPVDNEELVFYKSENTSRWWMEINLFNSPHNKTKKTTLLPCTEDDYLKACDQEIPERYWKAQRKSLL